MELARMTPGDPLGGRSGKPGRGQRCDGAWTGVAAALGFLPGMEQYLALSFKDLPRHAPGVWHSHCY